MEDATKIEPGVTRRREGLPPGTRQVVFGLSSELGFRDTGLRVAREIACFEFLPLGLFLRGATGETKIEDVLVGNQSQCWGSGIAGSLFSTARSFEELQRLAEAGEISVPSGARMEMDVVDIGVAITVKVYGPCEGVSLWGVTYEDGRHPHRSIKVESYVLREGSYDGQTGPEVRHRGRIVEHGLRGDRVVLDVKSPTEAGVCDLLKAFHRGGLR